MAIVWTPTVTALNALSLTGADGQVRDGLVEQLTRAGQSYDAQVAAEADYATQLAQMHADVTAQQAQIDRTTVYAGYTLGTDPNVVLSDTAVPDLVRSVLADEVAALRLLTRRPRPTPPVASAPIGVYITQLITQAQAFTAIVTS